jgi:hypothetical protein
MRNLGIVAALVGLAACGNAGAAAPDSNNPAHCIAAMNFGAYWLSKNSNHAEMVIEARARALFEAQKIKAAGRSLKAAKTEGAELTKTYGNDFEKMNALGLACSRAEDGDARFMEAKPTLIAKVRNGWQE